MTSEKPARPFSRFWRMVFWFTLIHLMLAGFGAFATFSEFGPIGSFHAFQPKELGLIGTASLWLFWNSALAECALAAGDLPALLVTWRWAHRMPCPRRMVVAYLVLTLFLAALHAAGAVNAARIGSFHTSTWNTEIGVDVVWPLVISDAILVLPPVLILARLIFRGWPTRAPGLCVSCGYDLTGNTSGVCPECGTPTIER